MNLPPFRNNCVFAFTVRHWLLVSPVAMAIVILTTPTSCLGQGCVPARYISLSLGAQGVTYLGPGDWEAGISYRYLHSSTPFEGDQERPDLYNIGGRIRINSIDVSVTYAINSRINLNLTVPFEHNDFSLIQGDLQRHGGSAGGLGDVRLVANTWLLDSAKHEYGNISLGVGAKFPTGNYRATDLYHTFGGEVLYRPVDIAAQPGDGGWGLVLQLQSFQRLVQNLYGYAEGLYLINPREKNGTPRPSPGLSLENSVPDQYFGRAGLSYVVWPAGGLSFSLGARIDGIPVGDAIGGVDNGFRRAGYSVDIDPGLNWSWGKNSFSINGPVAVYRNIEPTSTNTRGSFADFLIVASYTRHF